MSLLFNTKQFQFLIFIGLIHLLTGCTYLHQSSKKDFNSDFYKLYNINTKTSQKVYVHILNDTIKVYSTIIVNNKYIVDTTITIENILKSSSFKMNDLVLKQNSFDIDFFTTPLKFRPKQGNVPTQLNNTILNGEVYFGYRIDRFSIKSIINPLNKYSTKINLFGFSMGGFTGLGNTFLSPTNTNNILQQEYDGIVWGKGVAGNIAVNNLAIGLALGFDNLLDYNKTIWIYEGKPWLGLTLGLNLN